MNNKKKYFRAASALLLSAAAMGCASYEPVRKGALSEEPSREVVVSRDSVTIHYFPYIDSSLCSYFLGIKPARTGLAPSLLKIENNGPGILKVNLDKCVLEVGGDQCAPLAIDEVLARARRGGAEVVALQLGFGIGGMLAGANNVTSTNRSLEEDYHAKYFKPTLISPGKTAQGAVFNRFPDKTNFHNCVYHLNMTDLSSQEEITLSIQVPDSLLTTRRLK